MADQSDIKYQAGQAVGQAQVKKDEMVQSTTDHAQSGKDQASGLLQQTGEKMQGLAGGAADAAKNAVDSVKK